MTIDSPFSSRFVGNVTPICLHYLIVDPLFYYIEERMKHVVRKKKEGKARKFDEPYLGSKVQQNYLTIDHFSVFNASCLVWLISQI